MNRMMILSKPDILNAFSGKRTVHNVALHEFVHLIDKIDGAIDGIPEILIDKAFVLPWLRELRIAENRIKKHKSDINPYALTNNSEFLAVASEYFFMSPSKFKKKHTELYKYFSKIYRRRLKSDK
jgi:Mlc titration factor MtfA (ptsG expression regulator)